MSEQRVAVVTGSGRRSGIGQTVVRRLADDRLRVLVHGGEPHDAEMPRGADPGSAGALVLEVAAAGARSPWWRPTRSRRPSSTGRWRSLTLRV